MGRKWPLGALLIAFTLFPLAAQPPDEEEAVLSETKVVLRISRAFLRDLTEIPFSRQEPIRMQTMGAWVEGEACITGEFAAKIHKSTTESAFDLLVTGSVVTQARATRRPIVAYTSGQAPFDGHRRIHFSGKKFTPAPAQATATYHSQLDGVTTIRGGLGSRLVARLATPIVQRRLPQGDRAATTEIEEKLEQSIEQESDKAIPALNRVADVATTAIEILRERGSLSKKRLPLQLGATEDHLMAGIGPREQPLPNLPDDPKGEDAAVELWVRRPKADEPDVFKALEKYWTFVKPVLQKRLAERSPDFAAALEEVTATTIGEWRVVRLNLKRATTPG